MNKEVCVDELQETIDGSLTYVIGMKKKILRRIHLMTSSCGAHTLLLLISIKKKHLSSVFNNMTKAEFFMICLSRFWSANCYTIVDWFESVELTIDPPLNFQVGDKENSVAPMSLSSFCQSICLPYWSVVMKDTLSSLNQNTLYCTYKSL